MKKSTLLALISCLILAACSEEKPKPKVEKLKAEQIISFKTPFFACATKEAFHQAVAHSVHSEKTKFAAMFQRGECAQLHQGAEYKVLSIAERNGGYDIIEITTADSGRSEGAFTEWDYK